MKKLIIVFSLALFITGLVSAQVSVGSSLYVAVRALALKSSMGFFAGNRGTLNYGERVIVLQISGRFVEVRSAINPALTGWTATANLTTRQVVSGNTNTASAREVALAGKGFNQEVENAYMAKGNLNYMAVDRVEAITVRENDLRQFLTEGRLSTGDN